MEYINAYLFFSVLFAICNLIYFFNDRRYEDDSFTFFQILSNCIVLGLIWFYFVIYFVVKIFMTLFKFILCPMKYIKEEFYLIEEEKNEN